MSEKLIEALPPVLFALGSAAFLIGNIILIARIMR
jgi:hypothetical protein